MLRRERPPNFDRVARVYHWAEYLALGPLLQRTRTHFLPHILDRRRALVLGDGDGRFLAELVSAAPDIHVLAVDSSAAMLRLLKQRCLRRAPRSAMFRLRTMQASALEIEPSRDTDLVITHFLLDCFTQAEVDTLARRLAARLRPGTLWLLSDFGQPEKLWQRPFAALYVRALYCAFRLTTGLRVQRLPDPQSALTAAGFALRRQAVRLGGLLYTELWELAPVQHRKQPSIGVPATESQAMPPDEYSATSPDPCPDPRPDPRPHFSEDAQPDPEPAVPPLPEPDPGVFHHEPATPPPVRTTRSERA